MKKQRANKDKERAEQPRPFPELVMAAVLPDGNGGLGPCPELLTEEEVIRFLRIPEVSKSQDYRNVIENLKRMHDLPRIHVCGKPLYPLEEIRTWIKGKTRTGK
jgi:hypothetical protein